MSCRLESQLRDSCAQLFEAQGKSAAADAECNSGLLHTTPAVCVCVCVCVCVTTRVQARCGMGFQHPCWAPVCTPQCTPACNPCYTPVCNPCYNPCYTPLCTLCYSTTASLNAPPAAPCAHPLLHPCMHPLLHPCCSLHVVLLAAKESCEVMEKEVARLNQLNQDLKSTCQQLQATVDDLSRYNLPQCCAPSASA